MGRISERISATISTVKCPGCKKWVSPVNVPGTSKDNEEKAPEEDKRWSFIWLPPRGEVCPVCQFPLERYRYRAKWVAVFLSGVALLTIAGAFYTLTIIGSMGEGAVRTIADGAAVTGGVGIFIGISGLTIGGKHGVKRHNK
ncbi:MAG: hypothetical protein OEZ54_02505 [Gemmatimonadota bacterium]|nr:hypothetical protein [Gemmatimonadota bacterium]